MKPGGGGEVSPEQASLVVQLNSSTVPHNYASARGARGQGVGTRHKLPLSPSAPRFLPARNISAVARPLPKIMTSPKKNTSEQNDHDFMEGVVEKRPKYPKHLPPNFQYVVHEHNYAAPQPPPTQLCSPIPLGTKAINNGISVPPNGLNRGGPTQTLVPSTHHYHHPYPGQRAYSRTVSSPMTSGTNTGVGTVSTLVPYRGPPSAVPPQSQQQSTTLLSVSGLQQPTPDDESDLSSDGESGGGRNLRRTGPPGTQPSNLPALLGPQDDGEETETAPEDEDSVTRCICDFQHDDGYMICCDKCLVWQHVDCMGIERGNIPDEYRCEECEPRKVDKARAIRIQVAKRTQFNDSSDSLESARDNTPPSGGRATGGRKQQSRSVSRGGNSRRERGGKSASGGRQWRQADKKQTKHKGKPKQRRNANNKKSEKKEAISSLERSPSPLPPAPQAGLNQLRQWIDSYEEAVTNHYSPELRARVAAIKTNGLHSSDSAKLSAILPAVPKCKVSLMPTGIKILVTTAVVGPNLPIIEVRGKYMLSKSPTSPVGGPGGGGSLGSGAGGSLGGNSGSGGGGGNNPKWSPYVFHHRLSQADHTTEICVDTTTYGNDARFVRRSCRPNAELRHCIEKGALHLYIVSTSQIESKTEITLPVTVGQYCSCGLADKCQANHIQYHSTQDKRRRGRRRTMSESSGPLGPPERAKTGALGSTNIVGNQASAINNNNNNISKDKEAKRTSYQSQLSQRNIPSPPKVAKISPTPSSPDTSPNAITSTTISSSSANVTTSPGNAGVATSTTSTTVTSITSSVVNSNSKVRGQTVSTRRATTPATRQEERKRATAAAAANSGNSAPSQRSVSPNNLQGVKQETSGKMTREERKMEAIMKAIERLEKDEARKQQTVSGTSSGGSGTGSGSGGSSVGSRARKSSISISPHRERYERAASIKKKATRSVRETRSSKSSMRTRRGKHVQVVTSRRSTTRRATVTGGTSSKRSPANNRNDDEDDEDEEEDEELISNSSSAGAIEGGGSAVGSSSSPTPPAQSLRRTTRRNAGLKVERTPTQLQSPAPPSDERSERDEQMMEEPTVPASTISHLPDQGTTTNGTSPTMDEEVLQEHSAKLPPSQPLQVDTPNKLECVNQIASTSDMTQSPNVSSSCLLVPATTVGGPLAPGFKFPRTKKNYMSSWFGTDASQSNAQTTVCGSSSPPRSNATVQALAPDCAKKRWLRQAISEDSDSPKQAEAVSPTEMAAPLKKRRFARESVSSEHSFTPPATPQADSATQLFDDEENSLTSPTECNGTGNTATVDMNHKMEISSSKEHEPVNGPKTPPPSSTLDPPLDPTDDYEGLRREMSAAYDILSTSKLTSQSAPTPSQPPPPPPPPPQPEETPPPPPNSIKEEARVKRKLNTMETDFPILEPPPFSLFSCVSHGKSKDL